MILDLLEVETIDEKEHIIRYYQSGIEFSGNYIGGEIRSYEYTDYNSEEEGILTKQQLFDIAQKVQQIVENRNDFKPERDLPLKTRIGL